MKRRAKNTYPISSQGDYRQTDTYANASKLDRKLMNRYFRQLELDPQQMYLIVRARELDEVSDEERKAAAFPSQAIVIMVAFAFMDGIASGSTQDPALIIVSLLAFAAVVVVYFTGVLDPYKMAQRKVKKLLGAYPQVQDLDSWIREHADEVHAHEGGSSDPSHRSQGKKKRRRSKH
ncbi:MAG: hypothetical protein PUD09_02760 [Coriobacteriales bacterium]|nr:hypothetical protein [Coriobacteriales bacterium]